MSRSESTWIPAVITVLLAVGAVTRFAPTSAASPDPTTAATPWHLVALGDSIVSTRDSSGKTYPDRFAALIEAATGRAVEVTNLADPAATSGSLLSGIQTDTIRSSLETADIVTITVGGNDADPTASYPPGTCAPTSSLAACLDAYNPSLESNLAAIVEAIDVIRGGASTAVRVTSPDYDPFIGLSDAPTPTFGVDFYRQAAGALTQAACETADRYGARCSDIFHIFNGLEGFGDAAPFLAADHLHPGDTGVAAIAQSLMDLGLTELDPALAPAGTSAPGGSLASSTP